MTEFRTLLSNFVKKSQINGLLKNDGTVDTTDYISTSNTQGLLKNDGTVDTTNYLSTHQDITGKEDKSNKVTSIGSSSTDTEYPSAKCVYDNVKNKLEQDDIIILNDTYYSSSNTLSDFVTETVKTNLTIDYSTMTITTGANVISRLSLQNSSDYQTLEITFNCSTSNFSNIVIDEEMFASISTPIVITLGPRETLELNDSHGGGNTITYTYRRKAESINKIGGTIYPVGAIYMSVNNTRPEILFGGRWSSLTDRFLLGAGGTYAVDSTGGSATVTLTSAQSGVPAHSHKYQDYNTTYTLKTTNRKPGTSTAVAYGTSLTAGGGATERTSSNNTAANASQAHNNMPPYMAVYMWKRTA